MSASRLNPWNWFKKEHEQDASLPVHQPNRPPHPGGSRFDQLHAEFDRMMDSMFSDFRLPAPGRFFDMSDPRMEKVAIKPKVDVYGTEKEYVVEADLPGIEEKDLSIELKDDMLILSAEKTHEEKTKDKGYYRVERSYGSFRRVLNVPEDADRENINAKLQNGVLCIRMPRIKTPEGEAKKIKIESE